MELHILFLLVKISSIICYGKELDQQRFNNTIPGTCHNMSVCTDCIQNSHCFWCENEGICKDGNLLDIFQNGCHYAGVHYHSCTIAEVFFLLIIVFFLTLVLITSILCYCWNKNKNKHVTSYENDLEHFVRGSTKIACYECTPI